MSTSRRRRQRDIEKNYPPRKFVEKLRRLADAVEASEPFRIQIAGERITIPAGAAISLEHERSSGAEEVEFQLRWRIK